MAEVIELKQDEEPRKHERYAMVLVSMRPAREGAVKSSAGYGRTFYAYDNLSDVASVLARAKAWADENIIARVYVRRGGHNAR
jgi:hypothetical protein